MRTKVIVAAIIAAVLAYCVWRLFVHSSNLLAPVVITPGMDIHKAVSPDFRARVNRLVHREGGGDRSRRPRLIALTFDDGPYPITTPLLLEELASLKIPATFFLIGRDAQQYPELAQRIERMGNEVANHTFSHPNLDELSDAGVRAEVLQGRAELHSLVPADRAIDNYFRPPHGRFTEQTLDVVQSLGYHTILWSDDAGDWRTVTSTELADHLRRYATAPDIVLLHSGRLPTIEMLPAVAAEFRSAGYRFVTVSQLLAAVPAEETNHPAKGAL